MSNELEETLLKAGLKKKDAVFLIKLAKRKNISLGRAFFLYAWKYYAWSGSLFILVVFVSIPDGIEFLIANLLFCLAVAFISLFFSPFVINLIWSIKIQIRLIGK
ncbi:hypothetical protein [Pseudocitrobacter faecalis]|uniref:Uncharacterized protein n=1 Tax=Pseudocitrobacter faecalis TaxID=1398493 RepID=A0ABX9G2M9_9ENTR|nr:hypothetical protein [Pseudocitrobacter faecalis]RBP12606.1 hypothetical protein DFQ50_103216 [Pseudocitrobacter faecalis]